VLGVATVYGVILARGRLGREILAVGTQVQLARYSGLSIRQISLKVFIASALACAVAGRCALERPRVLHQSWLLGSRSSVEWL
jgi:ribose/xylose/arabinose/galactoside ABC-type transport system permease subunit